jgi:hypothetical protein
MEMEWEGNNKDHNITQWIDYLLGSIRFVFLNKYFKHQLCAQHYIKYWEYHQIFVFYDLCNKTQQTWWLKPAKFIIFHFCMLQD